MRIICPRPAGGATAILACAAILSATAALAQGFGGNIPAVEPPPRDFATAEQHYAYLLQQANGGTHHTVETVPQWEGLWSSGGNTVTDLFLAGGGGGLAAMMSGDAPVKEGVLTPPYEQQFRERRAEIQEYGEQRYDRLTNCEYPGVARWLMEPYVKEFVNLPDQSWMMNDFMNETRRIYIDAEHVNIEGTHSADGDSIGFWNADELVIWTKWINPADYFRGLPLTSNQLELVERWRMTTDDDGKRQLVAQVTFYDPLSLAKPISAVYTHNPAPDLEEAGVRIRNWECETSSNSYQDEEGNTLFHLPGDPEYRDARGSTAFPDLPGQSLNPIYGDEGGLQ